MCKNLNSTATVCVLMFLLLTVCSTSAVRSQAYDPLAFLDTQDALIEEAITQLQDEDPFARIEAIRTLVGIGDARVLEPLIDLLKKDDDWEVRMEVVKALGNCGDTRAVDPLIDLLRNYDESALAGQDDEEATMYLGDEWDTGPDILQTIAEALGNLGDNRAVEPLTEAIQKDDPGLSQSAIRALGSMGPKAKDAVPALILALKSKDSNVRAAAAWALGSIGLQAESAVPALIRALRDDDPFVRMSASSALGTFGPSAKAAVPALVELLKDKELYLMMVFGAEEDDEYSSPVEALGQIGPAAAPAVPTLFKLAAGEDEQFLETVSETVRQIGVAAIPGLIELLKNRDITIRNTVARMLGEFGPEANSAVPALAEAFMKLETAGEAGLALGKIGSAEAVDILVEAIEKGHSVDIAGRALADIGPGAKSRIPVLMKTLVDGDWNTSQYAAEALGAIGSPAVPALIMALQNEDPVVRQKVLEALQEIGPAAKEAVPMIAEILEDEDGIMNFEAAYALSAIVPNAEAAVPALIEALDNESLAAQHQAIEILGRIGPEAKSSVPALLEFLKAEDDSLQYDSVKALIGIGPGAEEAVPILVQMWTDKTWIDGQSIIRILRAIGPGAKPAIPVLFQALSSGSSINRQLASEALSQMGSPAVVGLIAALNDKNEEVVFVALSALINMKPLTDEVLTELVGLLRHEKPSVRKVAITALGTIGPKAIPAVPELMKALNDPQAKAVAAIALGKIGSAAKEQVPDLARRLVPILLIIIEEDTYFDYDEIAGAAQAINAIVVDESALVPYLAKIVRQRWQPVVVHAIAANALRKIGPQGYNAVPDLDRRLGIAINEMIRDLSADSGNYEVDRAQMACILGALGPAAAKAVPALMRMVQETHHDEQEQAIIALGRIGPKAKNAIPILTEISGGEYIRELTTATIKRIKRVD